MRHALPTVLALLLAAAGIVYALLAVSNDLRHVSDALDTVARDMSAMSDDVQSIADDVNAIAVALATDEDDNGQQQSTGSSRRAHAPRIRRAHLAVGKRTHPRVGIADVGR